MDEELLNKYIQNQSTGNEAKKAEKCFIDNIDNPDLDIYLWKVFKTCEEDGKEMNINKSFYQFCKRHHIPVGLKKRPIALPLWSVKVAAALLLAFFSYTTYLYFTGSQHQAPVWSEVYSGTGKSKRVLLPDNSVIILKPESKLIYDVNAFKKGNRDVFVTGGAYAEITKDKEHPFAMHCSGFKVNVLGTRFRVLSYDEDKNIEVMLYEGSVRLSSNLSQQPQTNLMKPGEMIRIEKESGKTDSYSINGINSDGQFNHLYFIDEPLGEIVKELSRHFDKKIIIRNQEVAKTKYDAVFVNNETLGQILASLNSSNELTITEYDNMILISGNN